MVNGLRWNVIINIIIIVFALVDARHRWIVDKTKSLDPFMYYNIRIYIY